MNLHLSKLQLSLILILFYWISSIPSDSLCVSASLKALHVTFLFVCYFKLLLKQKGQDWNNHKCEQSLLKYLTLCHSGMGALKAFSSLNTKCWSNIKCCQHSSNALLVWNKAFYSIWAQVTRLHVNNLKSTNKTNLPMFAGGKKNRAF